MKFTDIILVLSVSAVASALVATPNAETRSHQLSKRSPGKGWEKLIEGNPNDDDASEPGPSNDDDSSEPVPSNDGDLSEPGPSNDDSLESRLEDATRRREDICDKYHKYRKDLLRDASKFHGEDFMIRSPSAQYYDTPNINKSIEKRGKKMRELKRECKDAKRQEKDLRKEFEEQHGIKSEGKLKRLKKMLTKH
ncbi:hypothetical protein O5D80_007913 [Batrachochytrium dendrobatidis]|nr:hypothetical protein O5D80_007913 [Batrachochytrium dendrobatidis]